MVQLIGAHVLRQHADISIADLALPKDCHPPRLLKQPKHVAQSSDTIGFNNLESTPIVWCHSIYVDRA